MLDEAQTAVDAIGAFIKARAGPSRDRSRLPA